jgi:crotonobetainyl-CoA:carnitine CoA-transferase CaiB-like acyl-CoA transferase
VAGPLAGVSVVDCSTVVLGPWATRQLGDLGADVVKVEPPGGRSDRGFITLVQAATKSWCIRVSTLLAESDSDRVGA